MLKLTTYRRDQFPNLKAKLEEDGYTYVVFTGVCEYLGERADARITFQITGEQFRTEQLDLNGVEQNDLILYAMLAKIYEEY